MYATMNIPRGDRAGRLRQFVRNWDFFGAPIGMIFTIDRQMQQGQWADLGMFMENIMLLAREFGLHTCPQEAWAVWHLTIREYLSVPANEMIFCGLALGHSDETAPINGLESEREELAAYASFRSEA
jgi:nitroreductase